MLDVLDAHELPTSRQREQRREPCAEAAEATGEGQGSSMVCGSGRIVGAQISPKRHSSALLSPQA